jgi:DNA replication and repair protein RecF
MLALRKIIVTQFKNYNLQAFSFNKKVVGICGPNGLGKTNLLDAIYYCCFTKSYFSVSDSLNVRFNENGFRIESEFSFNDNLHQVVCINRLDSKKEFYHDEVLYEKLSKHIGLYPAVMIAPDDIAIINGGSEGRRKYIDTMLCVMDSDYLQNLMVYNKVLQQRNSLLKSMSAGHNNDFALLDVLDGQLLQPANYIFSKRKSFTETLLPMITKFYQKISGSNDAVSIQYESSLNKDSFEKILSGNRQKDIIMQRTMFGIHRDELCFNLDNGGFKSLASQGQKKSLLFALKLAEYQCIKINKGFSPLLLLDDVFEKLDENRMANLLRWVCTENDGQVFITDTHQKRLSAALEQLSIEWEIISL